MKNRFCLVLLLFISFGGMAQVKSDTSKTKNETPAIDIVKGLQDSLKKIQIIVGQLNEDLTFTGTRVVAREADEDGSGKLFLNGYVSAYYAYYSDSVPLGSYEKFPTVSPLGNTFSLNMVQLGAKYLSSYTRANFTFQYGDIPKSAWSPAYNNIQEANAGVKLFSKLWLDAGFFRTHIGLESIQPRENITSSIAVMTYYEPYFLSGAKLTYEVSPKLHVQLNAFNSFSTFVETNKKKAVGLSGVYDPNSKLSLTLNTLWNDNAPLGSSVTKGRVYNDFYLTYRTEKLTVGYELNVGVQEHSKLSDSTQTALMYSSLLAAKYKILKRLYVYGRFDILSDPDEILTGPVYNDYNQLIGLKTQSYTGGVEWKPIESGYIRFETRYIQSAPGEPIFYLQNAPARIRYEYLASVGVWF